MIKLFCILTGFYIVLDAVYLAAKSEGEHRFCTLAKYAGALMAGLYLIFGFGDDIRLLLGLTIALFMWPDTYFRVIDAIQTRYPSLYYQYLINFAKQPRRKSDYE